MTTTPLTTLTSASLALAAHMRRMQGETTKIQAEVATGRLFDAGKTLGSGTEALFALRQEITALQATIDVNGHLASRLDASQAALDHIVSNANDFRSALMSARGDARQAGIVTAQAESAFKGFLEAVNTAFGGVYVFSGLQTGTPPMSDYSAVPPPLSRQAMEAAFLAEFGFASTDPAAKTISASSMQAFADNAFKSLFADPGWSTNWTAATTDTVTSLIANDRTVSSSVSAQSEAFRSITAAFVLIVDGGTRNLNDAAYEAVIDTATKLLSEGIARMGELQGMLGIAQKSVEDATTSMEVRVNIASESIGKTEGVDPAELSVRLSALLNQLEATYAVTGRMQKLSLLDAL